jgi:hypothetical protein
VLLGKQFVTVVARHPPPRRYEVYCGCIYRKETELKLIRWLYEEIKKTLDVFFRITVSERRDNKKKMKLQVNSV